VSAPGHEREDLLQREGRFWDLQEEHIDSLFARPHDWRFVPHVAERIIAPRVRTLERLFAAHRAEIRSLLDVGCGNGWFCHGAAKRGIRCIGVDLSAKKIETARRLAEEQGVAHLCEFVAGDVLEWRPRERVDMLTSHGSLHHFPDFERAVGVLVEHCLRPGGLMLFVEPNFEGMPPGVKDFLLGCARKRWLAPLFDLDFYLEVRGQTALDQPPAQADEMDIRQESPAGKEFFGEHVDLDRYFREHFELLEARYFHYFSGHATNAFYVFMKSRVVRGLWRALLPLLVWYDDRLSQRPERRVHAEEGLWFLRQLRG
jgi:2-polyprenyl-3-methyl-5-hydroxy-6-metoxy-1,4-benzoquinol methylase